jgi:hypothetical protein
MVLSFIEFEIIIIITTTKEALWLRQLLRDLNFPQDGPTCFHCDNQSCIKSIQNACFQDWSKHIELWFHFLQEKIDLQELELHFTSIETMWTDILTKSLPKPKHGLCFQARAYFNTSAVKGGVIIDNWFQLHRFVEKGVLAHSFNNS